MSFMLFVGTDCKSALSGEFFSWMEWKLLTIVIAIVVLLDCWIFWNADLRYWKNFKNFSDFSNLCCFYTDAIWNADATDAGQRGFGRIFHLVAVKGSKTKRIEKPLSISM